MTGDPFFQSKKGQEVDTLPVVSHESLKVDLPLTMWKGTRHIISISILPVEVRVDNPPLQKRKFETHLLYMMKMW